MEEKKKEVMQKIGFAMERMDENQLERLLTFGEAIVIMTDPKKEMELIDAK